MNQTKATILTIDDERIIRESFKAFLEDYDYKVITAENGRHGIEVFNTQKPDLILVDLRMPEMDGLEVLARLSAISDNIPKIVISGTGLITDVVEALHRGAWDYLLKPIEDMDVLLHVIEKNLDKARLQTENLRYQNELEQLVKQRTQELEKLSDELKTQNNEYQALNEELKQSNNSIHLINNELELAKNRAEESDRLKSAFLANMSHEIRTPMNAIVGFADLLLENPNADAEKRTEFVNIIKKCSDDLLNIINDILDLSKIEAGLIELRENTEELNNLLIDVYDLLKNTVLKSSVSLKLCNTLENKCIIVQTDILRLKQVLINLVSNALKFTNEGYAELGCKYFDDNHLLFYVRDTGIGIADDKKDVIFQRFRQGEENSLSRNYGGTGLGLSISKGLVECMGGKIWFESKVNEGSTFYFTLPILNTDVKVDHAIQTKPANYVWKSKKILIVEDNYFNKELLLEMLRKTGVQTLDAENATIAQELIQENKDIDLILMDVRLPDMNGLDLSAKIKSENQHVIIVAQTAFASEIERKDCLKAGCDNYISKPINKAKLLKILESYLGKNVDD